MRSLPLTVRWDLRLCLGHADAGQTGDQFVAPILSELLKFVPSAASMRPSSIEVGDGVLVAGWDWHGLPVSRNKVLLIYCRCELFL